jgi:molecular chaperone GrpE (heat shock protein)
MNKDLTAAIARLRRLPVTLIDLNDPKNVARRGDVPEDETDEELTALRAENKRLREAAAGARDRLKIDAMRVTVCELLELADNLTAALSTSEGGK